MLFFQQGYLKNSTTYDRTNSNKWFDCQYILVPNQIMLGRYFIVWFTIVILNAM